MNVVADHGGPARHPRYGPGPPAEAGHGHGGRLAAHDAAAPEQFEQQHHVVDAVPWQHAAKLAVALAVAAVGRTAARGGPLQAAVAVLVRPAGRGGAPPARVAKRMRATDGGADVLVDTVVGRIARAVLDRRRPHPGGAPARCPSGRSHGAEAGRAAAAARCAGRRPADPPAARPLSLTLRSPATGALTRARPDRAALTAESASSGAKGVARGGLARAASFVVSLDASGSADHWKPTYAVLTADGQLLAFEVEKVRGAGRHRAAAAPARRAAHIVPARLRVHAASHALEIGQPLQGHAVQQAAPGGVAPQLGPWRRPGRARVGRRSPLRVRGALHPPRQQHSCQWMHAV